MRRMLFVLNLATFCIFTALVAGCADATGGPQPAPVVEKSTPVAAVNAEQGKDDGYGSISGKVTLGKEVPAVESLVEAMKKHADAKCCLDPEAKEKEKIDLKWIVDPKTKAVANVMVWVTLPKGKAFPIHKSYQKRTEKITLDQPHCQFLPRVLAYQPYYKENGKTVATGQTIVFKNSSVVNHNVRVIGNGIDNDGFNINVTAKSEYTPPKEKDLKPQRLPLEVKCDIHTWMTARIFVFDHPYYALTNEKGEFEIPHVPAGMELTLMAWHENEGYVLRKTVSGSLVIGEKMKIENGKKTTFDIVIK
jgi:plastocyanin